MKQYEVVSPVFVVQYVNVICSSLKWYVSLPVKQLIEPNDLTGLKRFY